MADLSWPTTSDVAPESVSAELVSALVRSSASPLNQIARPASTIATTVSTTATDSWLAPRRRGAARHARPPGQHDAPGRLLGAAGARVARRAPRRAGGLRAGLGGGEVLGA